MSKHRLFANLQTADRTENAYRNLWQILALAAEAHPGTIHAEITKREADRMRELVDEYTADSDDCRAAILAAGYTPEDYEAWTDEQNARAARRAELTS